MLLSAHSSNSNVGVTTTGLVGAGSIENDYRDNFGGTSAAAPLVSGIIALMLEVNPELSWRDVQHILVETAVQNDPSNSDWIINGGGKHVNHFYGFGTVDAEAAVETAIDWTPVNPELLITEEFTGGLGIPDNNSGGVETAVTFNSDIQVEWAEVVLQATHPRRGDLEVVLVSPDGTESILAEQRSDFNEDYDWTFTSARHWGESSVGEWILRVRDLSSENTGTLDFAELRLYGTLNEVIDANQPPIAINDGAITDENSSVTIAVLVNDLDPDGDGFSLTGVSSPGNGSANISDNQIIYSPAANFVGNDSFNYTISDGSLTATATVTVTVEPVNQPPIAVNDTASVQENRLVNIAVLANDLDPDGDRISLTGVSSPGNGSVSISNNQVIYSPDANFAGSDSFRYTISDARDTDTATVTVTVESSAIGDAQIITPLSSTQSASANQLVSIDVQYSTNPANSLATGLGQRLHWDSTKLGFNSLADVLSDDLLAQGTPEEDTDNFDNDPTTDRFITVTWADFTGGSWPNDPSSLPISLYRANFTTTSDFADSTTVNFSTSATTAGFDFASTSATIGFG